jgi:hypothetical protein
MEVNFTRFESFAGIDGLVHAVFTRHGGVSAAPFATLNQSFAVPDDPDAVRENRRRALAALDWPDAALIAITQVHGTDVYHASEPIAGEEPLPEADVLLSGTPGLALFMRYADGAPLLRVDPLRRAVALAHAGWRGTVAGVAARAVQALVDTGRRPGTCAPRSARLWPVPLRTADAPRRRARQATASGAKRGAARRRDALQPVEANCRELPPRAALNRGRGRVHRVPARLAAPRRAGAPGASGSTWGGSGWAGGGMFRMPARFLRFRGLAHWEGRNARVSGWRSSTTCRLRRC